MNQLDTPSSILIFESIPHLSREKVRATAPLMVTYKIQRERPSHRLGSVLAQSFDEKYTYNGVL